MYTTSPAVVLWLMILFYKSLCNFAVNHEVWIIPYPGTSIFSERGSRTKRSSSANSLLVVSLRWIFILFPSASILVPVLTVWHFDACNGRNTWSRMQTHPHLQIGTRYMVDFKSFDPRYQLKSHGSDFSCMTVSQAHRKLRCKHHQL